MKIFKKSRNPIIKNLSTIKTPTIRFVFLKRKLLIETINHTDICLGILLKKQVGRFKFAGAYFFKDSFKILNNCDFDFNKFVFKNQNDRKFHTQSLKT